MARKEEKEKEEEEEEEEERALCGQICRVLDDCRLSLAVHPRKLKELSALRSSSSSSPTFFAAFSKSLTPLFNFPRKSPSADRAVRFVSAFAARGDDSDPDAFLDDFLRFLLSTAQSANKTARSRSCQIISEIIMRLPDDAEVSDELWDDVIDCMMHRVEDKVPVVRIFAVRALARFANDSENVDIVDKFLHALLYEQNAEVRKTIVLSIPPSNLTSGPIIERTLDVSDSVRKAAYCVLANKFPLQSLSIKLRTVILQRGLMDRSSAVAKECFKLLKDEWLEKSCNGDPILLLKFLDVETYESVGEAVMEALLKAGAVHVQDGQSIKQYLGLTSETDAGHFNHKIRLMEAEIALYWRTLCRHLQVEAQIKGSDAAATSGTEAAVYAAEASDSNDLLEIVLPETVSDYIELVRAHLAVGPNYRFATRQLLLLGTMLDFSDSTNRKVASAFVHELLHRPLEHEVDDEGNKVVIGDGIYLGGDKDWAKAVSELAKKVHASVGEFEEIVSCIVDEIGRPCRERAADFVQWMHCLAVTGLLLENINSVRCLHGKAIEASELLNSLILPGAKHINADVQRVALRCLGLFGLAEKKPSEELVRQLRLSFISSPPPVSIMASKALLDLGLWHGPLVIDRAVGKDRLPHSGDERKDFSPVDMSDANGVQSVELLDLLYSKLEREDSNDSAEPDDHETIHSILGEGFAKILLLSPNYPSIPASLHPLLFGKLINLYFSNELKDLLRLKQCLSVFFDHYPALSADNKKCISKAFIPVMRSMWPGIYGNSGGASHVVSAQRKRAIQASRFMLEMMQLPLYAKESDEQHGEKTSESPDGSIQSLVDVESGEEGLAIRIAAEVASCPLKKTPAGKSYILALCKILPLLRFRPSEKASIKCMRGLMGCIFDSVSTDKELLKELRQLALNLKAIDDHPDEELLKDHADLIFGKLDININLDADISCMIPPTPMPRSTRTGPTKRRTRKQKSSDDEESSPINVPMTPNLASGRSQRASKTEAMTRMSSRTAALDLDEESEVTSEEVSEESSDDFAE